MSTERIWLLAAVVLVVTFTLAPFETFVSTYYLRDRIAAIFELGDSLDPLKMLGHLGSFFLIGVLVAAVYEPQARGRSLIRYLLPVAAGCLILEAAQFCQFGRHARAFDVVLNVAGFGLALWLTDSWQTGRAWRHELQAMQKRRPFLEVIVPSIALLIWWGFSLQPAFGSLRMEWDRSCHLSIANEVGGARPWLGQLQYCGVYGRALNAGEVARVFEQSHSRDLVKARTDAGLLMGYDFRKSFGLTIPAEGPFSSPAFQLTAPGGTATQMVADGILVKESSLLETPEPVTGLTDRIISSAAFSVEAWIRATTLTQAGPARIVALSNSVERQNFILGQERDSLIFRVRNKFSRLYGADGQIEGPGLIDQQPGHFVAVYDHGVSKIYKDGRHRETVDLREPFYYSRLSTTTAARVAFFMLAAVTIAWPSFGLLSRWYPAKSAAWIAGVFTFLACSAPYIVSCLTVGGAWVLNFFCWLAASLLLIYPAGLLYVLKPQRAL